MTETLYSGLFDFLEACSKRKDCVYQSSYKKNAEIDRKILLLHNFHVLFVIPEIEEIRISWDL